MMAESFEYAIRKDVRNNPIVREVDDAKQRDLWKTVAVAGLFVVILLFWAWPRFEMLRRGYRLEEMQSQRQSEEETTRQLRLQVETLTSPKRIETLATEKLHLVTPTREEAIVIERVVPSEPPARSVVARR
jgi:cell division protein FtsL